MLVIDDFINGLFSTFSYSYLHSLSLLQITFYHKIVTLLSKFVVLIALIYLKLEKEKKIFFFSKGCRYKYNCSVIKKLEIALSMESSFPVSNEAGANQVIKFFHADETSRSHSLTV